MGSPDNRRKADDSCQALRVGRSMSDFLHDKHWVRSHALPQKSAPRLKLRHGGLGPARERLLAATKEADMNPERLRILKLHKQLAVALHVVIAGIDLDR